MTEDSKVEEPFEVHIIEPEPKPEVPLKTLWGRCRITAYCPCSICCGSYALNRPTDANGNPIVYGASGSVLTNGYSCASSLPFGTRIYIPQLNHEFIVQDRAAQGIHQRYNGMYVDIYISDHQECFNYLAGQPDYMEVYYVN